MYYRVSLDVLALPEDVFACEMLGYPGINFEFDSVEEVIQFLAQLPYAPGDRPVDEYAARIREDAPAIKAKVLESEAARRSARQAPHRKKGR